MSGAIAARRWTVSPNIGLGSLTFGMPRERVRSAFSGVPEEFRGSRAGKVPADYFRDAEVQAFYDDEEKLVRLKLYEPAHAFLDGVDLIGSRWKDLRRTLSARHGKPLNLFGLDAYISVGICLAEEDGRVWSVEVFAPGFYDALLCSHGVSEDS